MVQTPLLLTDGSYLTLQSPGEGEVGGRVARRKMVDKGQVTDDIEVTISSAEVTSSEHCEAPTQGTSTGHRVTPHGMVLRDIDLPTPECKSPFLITLYIISKIKDNSTCLILSFLF